ncbi:hypothetical protein CHCC14427_2728 [Bacillus paralicheniformis]|nr:hypothetical protein CHCC14427_2728 [Bacillus paralicheniformis]
MSFDLQKDYKKEKNQPLECPFSFLICTEDGTIRLSAILFWSVYFSS